MTRRPRRRLPPIWLWILWVLALGGIVALRFGDLGDEGMRNVFSTLIAFVALFLGYTWFVLRSGFPGRVRAGVGLGTVAAIVAGAALFRVQGFSGAMVPEFVPRYGGERELAGVAAEAASVDLSRTSPDDFPGFLGRERDAHVPHVRLDPDWATRPPETLWKQEIGAGWSGFAVVNGVAVTMEQRDEDEAVTAYDLASGELLWIYTFPGHFTHFLGGEGPRATPSIDEGRVYALGALGRLVCLDGASGVLVWERDLLADYGVTSELEFANVQYGRSNSPLLVDEWVIVPVGGDPEGRMAGLVAFDKGSGESVWESPPRQISFSSPRLAQLGGVTQVLIVNEDTLSGHALEDGALLWEHPWPGRTAANASVSQAVPVPPDRVFVSKGYGVGSMLLQLVPREGGGFDATSVWSDRRALRTKLTNVVLKDGHAYGLSDGILECVELETGERVWRDGRYGHGQILLVGELLLVLGEEGELVLVEPTPDEENRVLGRVQALEGKTWNNLALFGDVLLVRNALEAAAFRLPLAEE